jgi:hypothetical protein
LLQERQGSRHSDDAPADDGFIDARRQRIVLSVSTGSSGGPAIENV